MARRIPRRVAGHALVPVLAVAVRRRAGPGARARARAARARRRRPCHRPLRRPAAGAGDHHRRPEHARARATARWHPIATGRAVARRTIEASRTFEPDVMHLHEPFSPGANHAALVGTTIPAVGTFHSARAGRNGWYETLPPGHPPADAQLAVSTAVSEDAARQVTQTFGGECEILPNGVEVDALRQGPGRAVRPPPRSSSSAATSRARGSAVLLDAFDGLDRDADLWVDRRRSHQDAAAAAGGVPRRRVAGPGLRRREGRPGSRGATVACFPALDGESFGVVLLEAMAAGDRRRRLRHRRLPHRRPPGPEALLVPPGDRRRAPRRRSAGSSTTTPRRAGWWPWAGPGPTSSRWTRLAERFLPPSTSRRHRRAPQPCRQVGSCAPSQG